MTGHPGPLSRPTAGPTARPLDGITVVSLEHAIAAPYCTRHLADLGARVIKIERPGVGDFARGYDERVRGMASHFVWTNRSKESLTLDLKADGAAEVLDRLVARADVLVQNLAPGAAARLGLSYEAVSAKNPGIIVCDISGYGDDGPYRDKKAYDLLIQAEGGFLSVTGGPDAPAKAGCSIADIAAGMYAFNSVLAGIIQRGRTGRGARYEVSMLESMVEWMGYPLYYAFEDQAPPARAGASHATIYPYGPFPTGDGRSVLLGLQNEREWVRFCEVVLERPELAADPRFDTNARRSAAREELAAIIAEAFAGLDREAAMARLDRAGIANAGMNGMADLWAHPQLAAREHFATIDSPVGPLPSPRPPGRTRAYEPRLDPVPALGEHTGAILAELGYSAQEIAALAERGAT